MEKYNNSCILCCFQIILIYLWTRVLNRINCKSCALRKKLRGTLRFVGLTKNFPPPPSTGAAPSACMYSCPTAACTMHILSSKEWDLNSKLLGRFNNVLLARRRPQNTSTTCHYIIPPALALSLWSWARRRTRSLLKTICNCRSTYSKKGRDTCIRRRRGPRWRRRARRCFSAEGSPLHARPRMSTRLPRSLMTRRITGCSERIKSLYYSPMGDWYFRI